MIDYSEGFYISICTLVIGFLGLTIKQCLASKCDNVVCCCLKIHRAVDLEERIEERRLDYGIYDKTERNNTAQSLA